MMTPTTIPILFLFLSHIAKGFVLVERMAGAAAPRYSFASQMDVAPVLYKGQVTEINETDREFRIGSKMQKMDKWVASLSAGEKTRIVQDLGLKLQWVQGNITIEDKRRLIKHKMEKAEKQRMDEWDLWGRDGKQSERARKERQDPDNDLDHPRRRDFPDTRGPALAPYNVMDALREEQRAVRKHLYRSGQAGANAKDSVVPDMRESKSVRIESVLRSDPAPTIATTLYEPAKTSKTLSDNDGSDSSAPSLLSSRKSASTPSSLSSSEAAATITSLLKAKKNGGAAYARSPGDEAVMKQLAEDAAGAPGPGNGGMTDRDLLFAASREAMQRSWLRKTDPKPLDLTQYVG